MVETSKRNYATDSLFPKQEGTRTADSGPHRIPNLNRKTKLGLLLQFPPSVPFDFHWTSFNPLNPLDSIQPLTAILSIDLSKTTVIYDQSQHRKKEEELQLGFNIKRETKKLQKKQTYLEG